MQKPLKMELACHLYQRGELTLGQAAETVGYSKETYTELLGTTGFTFFNYNADEIDEDVTNATKHSL